MNLLLNIAAISRRHRFSVCRTARHFTALGPRGHVISIMLAAALTSAALAADDPHTLFGPRSWDDAKKHHVDGTFIGLHDGKVTLKKEDGTTIDVPLEKLSVEHQTLAKALAEFGPRTWSDVSKTHHIEATFVGINGEKAALKKADGATTEVPLEKLNPEDRKLAKSLQEKKLVLEKQFAANSANAEKDEDPFTSGTKAEPLTVREITRKVENGVVSISTRDSLGASAGMGSGFLIDASGLVATNYHVIKEASSASVRFRDGAEVEVTGYRAIDSKRDIAILQLKSVPKSAAVLKVAADGPKQGDSIMAIGHPGGFEFSVASGIVSAIRKTSEMPDDVKEFLKTHPDCKWIQITAPSAPGSSGGPLLNSQGDVVGIVSWIVPRLSIGFAVHMQHLGDLRSRTSAKARPLPVPGLFQGPGVSEPSVLAELASFRQDMETMLTRAAAVEGRAKGEEILKTENPVPAYIAKFRLLAESKPKSRQEFESLITIVRIAQDDSPESRAALKWALPRILENYAENELLGGLTLELCKSESLDAQAFIRGVIEKSPDKTVKGIGYFALGVSLLSNPKTRGRRESDAIASMENAIDECGSMEFGDEPFRVAVERLLERIKSYSVGHVAADIVGKDSKGRPLRLSNYRGKVVVLDFWADWCPYCRQMYPQEREMAAKYAGRPFDILGVNCDELSRLRKTEDARQVLWLSMADGRGGPIVRKWHVDSYPTLFLIAPDGTIQRKGLREDALNGAVESMLKGIELGATYDLIAPSSAWAYHDEAQPPEPGWNGVDFDDSQWKSGRGVFGFGLRGDETTQLTPDKSAHGAVSATIYFRREFTAKDMAAKDIAAPALLLGLTYADGAAVYLNGREILRDNLKPGAKHQDASPKEAGSGGLVCRFFKLDSTELKAGKNVVAVEVHSHEPRKGGLRFDLNLSALPKDAAGSTASSAGKFDLINAPTVRRKLKEPLDEAAEFTWNRGADDVKMIPGRAGFCVLSSVYGTLMGGGERAGFSLGTDGWWHLGGESMQPALGASAMCITAKALDSLVAECKQVEWRQGEKPLRVIHKDEGFCVLASVAGHFDGYGEAVKVYLDEQDGYWYLTGKSGKESVRATAISIRFAHPRKIKISSYEWKRGGKPVPMLKRDEGFCFLSRITGRFLGAGEQVTVGIGKDDRWFLRGNSGQDQLAATAIGIRFE
jgi:thiol-disulfide isomerase/thioredoxin